MEKVKKHTTFNLDTKINKSIDELKWDLEFTNRSKVITKVVEYLKSKPEIVSKIKDFSGVNDKNKE